MTAVLLVFQYGQPRIFFAMARDGLLPAWAAKVHPKYAHAARHDAGHRPGGRGRRRSSVDADEIYDLTNIGTLFAFAIVCIGVLVLRVDRAGPPAAVPRAVRVGRGAARAPRRVCSSCSACRARPGSGSGSGSLIGLVLYFVYGYRHSRLHSLRARLSRRPTSQHSDLVTRADARVFGTIARSSAH